MAEARDVRSVMAGLVSSGTTRGEPHFVPRSALLISEPAGQVAAIGWRGCLEDWRGWILHVNDDLGDELFVVPFSFVLGKPH
jgi:hypothetical protein